jgi:hypothetical protein
MRTLWRHLQSYYCGTVRLRSRHLRTTTFYLVELSKTNHFSFVDNPTYEIAFPSDVEREQEGIHEHILVGEMGPTRRACR